MKKKLALVFGVLLLLSLVLSGNVETFDLPSPGTYDFKVVDWVSQGDYVSSMLYDEDCSIEIGEIDYYMRVRLGDNVSLY